MYTDEELAAYRAFEDCGSVRQLRKMLDDGLISQLEFSKETLKVWDFFRRLPQYEHLNLKA